MIAGVQQAHQEDRVLFTSLVPWPGNLICAKGCCREGNKEAGAGNLFVIFGEPDVTLEPVSKNQLRVKVNGVDVFDPSTGEVRSDDANGIACWFIETDYNQESFFVRHAYFLGANVINHLGDGVMKVFRVKCT